MQNTYRITVAPEDFYKYMVLNDFFNEKLEFNVTLKNVYFRSERHYNIFKLKCSEYL